MWLKDEWQRLRKFLIGIGLIHRPKISLLIPFSSIDHTRRRNFKWLLKYWRNELPDAEIIIGRSRSAVFCKGEALNDALSRSNGKILVVLDADAYMRGAIINKCANRILEEAKRGYRLWFVPYRQLYRLTKEITDIIVGTSPYCPLMPPEHPPESWYDNKGDRKHYGHRYGAMITIFPREAMEILKCFDIRFHGWGGEDIAFLRAMDTLYAKHKTTHNSIFHLWHSNIGEDVTVRMWEGQTGPNINGNLTYKYHLANRNPAKMRHIINESHEYYKKKV